MPRRAQVLVEFHHVANRTLNCTITVVELPILGYCQTCQLTLVRPDSEFQTRLTRTVDENLLETHTAINDMRNEIHISTTAAVQVVPAPVVCPKTTHAPLLPQVFFKRPTVSHLSFAKFLLVLGPSCTSHIMFYHSGIVIMTRN